MCLDRSVEQTPTKSDRTTDAIRRSEQCVLTSIGCVRRTSGSRVNARQTSCRTISDTYVVGKACIAIGLAPINTPQIRILSLYFGASYRGMSAAIMKLKKLYDFNELRDMQILAMFRASSAQRRQVRRVQFRICWSVEARSQGTMKVQHRAIRHRICHLTV